MVKGRAIRTIITLILIAFSLRLGAGVAHAPAGHLSQENGTPAISASAEKCPTCSLAREKFVKRSQLQRLVLYVDNFSRPLTPGALASTSEGGAAWNSVQLSPPVRPPSPQAA